MNTDAQVKLPGRTVQEERQASIKAEKMRLIFREDRYRHSGCHCTPRGTGDVCPRWLRSDHRWKRRRHAGVSGIFDSLVMKTVDLDLFADQSGKKGVLLGEYQMSGIVPGDRSRIVIEQEGASERS